MRPAPLTPLQLAALLPYVLPRSPAGRPVGDLRARLDAIFYMACTTDPWRALPDRHGRPDTVSRYFRRLTHAGLWEKLLVALKESGPSHPLREIAPMILRACRRAARLRGIGLIVLIRRLGFLQALAGPPHQVCDPDLSETMRRTVRLPPVPRTDRQRRDFRDRIRALGRLHRAAGGVMHIPRALRLGWC